jgi:SNF2 family DNA or RNA helicase
MRFTPHAYQEYCIGRMIEDPALGGYLDMGLGKTVITLTAINDLRYNRFQVSRALVIAPKKVAEATWSKEAAKWDHLKHLRLSLVLGSEKQRIRALNTPADVWVINRENVVWLVEYYRNAWPFDMVIIDESSSFKSHQAKRFKALTWVRPHIKRIVELTGTPAPNGLIDLWAQLYLLDEGQRLGKKVTHYRERYFEPDRRNAQQVFSYRPKPGADEVIQQLIGDICISM